MIWGSIIEIMSIWVSLFGPCLNGLPNDLGFHYLNNAHLGFVIWPAPEWTPKLNAPDAETQRRNFDFHYLNN